MTVIGPPGTAQRLDEAMEALFPGSSKVQRRFSTHVIEHSAGTTQHLDRFEVTPFEVRHASGAPAYALRVSDHETQATLAYSGDTEWTDTLIDASEDADVFLCEGYSPQPVRWHLDLDSLARNSDRLCCRQLVLTHMSPTTLALDTLDWPAAWDGMVLDLPEK